MIVHVDSPDVLSENTYCESIEWRPDGACLEALLKERLFLPERLSQAVLKRKIEFLAGRYCAVRALEKAGCPDVRQPGINEDRSPVWPAGYVGSVTHTEGFASAAVAPDSRMHSLGVDTERIVSSETRLNVSEYVMTHAERERLAALSGPGLDADTFASILFSCKESIFKCLFPLVKTFIGFQDAELTGFETLASQKGNATFRMTFEAPDCAVAPGRLTRMDCRWAVSGEFVHSATELSRDK